MRTRALAGAARRIEETVVPRLRALAERTGVIGDVRGRGAMLAVEIVRPGTTEPDADRAARVAKACHSDVLTALTANRQVVSKCHANCAFLSRDR